MDTINANNEDKNTENKWDENERERLNDINLFKFNSKLKNKGKLIIYLKLILFGFFTIFNYCMLYVLNFKKVEIIYENRTNIKLINQKNKNNEKGKEIDKMDILKSSKK